MIGRQEQLSGSLIIIELTKIYGFALWTLVHFEKSVLEEVFVYITHIADIAHIRYLDGLVNRLGYSGNCSDCQMALQTNHFVDGTFGGFN